MHNTNRETVEQTLARLIAAMDRQQPVTITYFRTKTDENGRPLRGADGKPTGELEETVRTIEIHDIWVTEDGAVALRTVDRLTGEAKTRRLDRIAAYTVHRGMTNVIARDEDEQEPTVPTLNHPGLVAIEAGTGVDEDGFLPVTDPVEALALALALVA